MLRALVVDDERPAVEELDWLLRRDGRVAEVRTAEDARSALRALEDDDVDVVFLDVRMPGLDGLELARVLRRFRTPPAVVFVTAYEEHAVAAFELDAVDYLLKPVRPERLAEAVRRVIDARRDGSDGGTAVPGDETVVVELGGVTRFVQRSQVTWVEAQGDYARLHTDSESHLVRIPLAVLEERWRAAGFVRIHRSSLVCVTAIEELRLESGRCVVTVSGQRLQVARRHTRELRDLLVRGATDQPTTGAPA
ncbi:MAG: LytR/AlgR family response regulator transcription factor [Actinomycetales bacterium]